MKICFTTLGCPDWSIEKVCEKAVSLRAYGVELRAKAPELHINTETPINRVKQIKRMFDEAGIHIVGITGYTQFADPNKDVRIANEEQLLKNLELCQVLGADYVRTFIGFPPDPYNPVDVYSYIGESLRKTCEKAAGINASVLVETHDFASSGRSTRQILDSAGNPKNLGAIWDISHPPKAGESPEETWLQIGKYVQTVHIKDEYAERLPNGEIHQCFPGLGVLPLNQCLYTLSKSNFDGYYVVEWERAFNMNLAPLEDAFIAFRDYILSHSS